MVLSYTQWLLCLSVAVHLVRGVGRRSAVQQLEAADVSTLLGFETGPRPSLYNVSRTFSS